jgi:hypothetical protein
MAQYSQFDDNDKISGLVYSNNAFDANDVISAGKNALKSLDDTATKFLSDLTKKAQPKAATTNTIAGVIARKYSQSPQFDYMWRAELPSLKGKSSDLELNSRIESFETPHRQFETKKIVHGSTFYHNAGSHEVGHVALKIQEFEDGATLKYFDDWMKLIAPNEFGLYNPPFVYKKDLKFIRLTVTNFEVHYTLYGGCFPTSISPVAYSYESGEVTVYSVTISCDTVKHVFVPAEQVKMLTGSAQHQFTGSSGGSKSIGGGIINEVMDAASGFFDNAMTTAKNGVASALDSLAVGSRGYSSFDSNDYVKGLTY